MNIQSKNHSSYPRVGDLPEQQRLRKAYNQYDKGKVTAEEVARILDETVAEIIKEQLESGCDIVTDGQIRSFDPLSYPAGKIEGFEITGLLRFFDTNYLYRQPRVTGVLSSDKPLFTDDYSFMADIAGDKSSMTFFGPYSLLKMSNVSGDFEKHLEELVSIYAIELTALKKSGVSLVQLDEPAIIHHPEDFALLSNAYKALTTHKPNIPEILMALYFGNATPYIKDLNEMPVDGILFDFTYSPGLREAIAGFAGNIGLGIIDGRNTKMEEKAVMVNAIESILSKVKSSKAYISSSCGLEFLPRNRAFDKLKLCADIASEIRGGK